ncbi:MAG: asparagine synthase (glutamine-hydrolyzing) [archaeon]
MCGICGITWEDKALVKRMAKKLEHRGPDSDGFLIDKHVSLGFRRLAIIDLSPAGDQPIFNEDKNIAIFFNGEVYNFKELREDLEKKGHRFSSHTDTEAIVHAYEEYGTACLGRLNGMFGLCIYDMDKKKLFIARDRLGIKPLYYHMDKKQDGGLIFASELKALLEDDRIKRKINLRAFNNYLTFKYVPGPESILDGIQKLQPGHYMEYDLAKKKLSVTKYWEMDFSERPVREADALKRIDSLLTDSVRRRMISDVPLGVFLSGGLDSSLITAIMAKHSSEPVKTFSVGFDTEAGRGIAIHNELEHANLVAEKFGTVHHELIMSFDDIIKMMPQVTYHMDEPMSDLASIPTYMISKLAKRKVTVALAGDGADEIFVGYRQSILNHYSDYLRAMPRFWTKALPRTHKARRAADILGIKSPVKRAAAWGCVFDQPHREEVLSKDVKKRIEIDNEDVFSQYREKMQGYSRLHQNLYFEAKTWLPDDLLAKVDRTSMMTSLEARVPFLDHRLFEYVAHIPAKMKLHGMQTKILQKKVARRYLPRQIIDRKKHGFTLPTGEWFKRELRSYADDLLRDKAMAPYLDGKAVDRILHLHRSGKEDYAFQLNNLITFASWHKIYIEGVSPSKL